VVFGGVSLLAVRQRNSDQVNSVVPAVGAVGAAAFFPLLLYRLYAAQPGTFYTVLLLAAAVLGVELFYFERTVLERRIERVERGVESLEEGLERWLGD
jgi:hypothetical protein